MIYHEPNHTRVKQIEHKYHYVIRAQYQSIDYVKNDAKNRDRHQLLKNIGKSKQVILLNGKLYATIKLQKKDFILL